MTDDVLKGSEIRLWALVEERAKQGADQAAIDQRIWDLFGEDWAVMFTDLSGFSRRVAEFGILHFLQIIFEHKRLLLPIVADHDGILVKIEADSFLIIFRRASAALKCAVAMQHACQKLNVGRKPEDEVLLCLGIGYGRILRIGDVDVYGREVNSASKLGEDTATANEILVTEGARAAIGDMKGIHPCRRVSVTGAIGRRSSPTGQACLDARTSKRRVECAIRQPCRDASAKLQKLEDTRFIHRSNAWAQTLTLLDRARSAGRTNPDILRAIAEVDDFLKQKKKRTKPPAPPVKPPAVG